MKNKGITLIALVVTIVVLLILAGVSITAVFGENGIINGAQKASEKTQFATEKEAIEFAILDIETGLMIGEEIPKEKYIGEKLSSMSAITGDWKNVTVGENTYEDGWYLVEKGSEITGYGKAKLNWLINYDTGEVIELKEGEYIVASANASGAIVDETLKLNIDPVNLQNKEKWGTGVSFIDGDGSNESGVQKTEIKFDGKDDYLKIENANVEKSGGLTFEFYGKVYGDETVITNFLGRNKFDEDGNIKLEGSAFRVNCFKNKFRMQIGNGNCESDLSEALILDGINSHWMRFGDVNIIPQEINYISFSVDFKNCEIKVYQDGKFKQETTCSKEYLESGDAFNNEIPFVVGMLAQGWPVEAVYSQLDLYACRLYTRVLTDTEISQNYIATTNYHNDLLK